MKPFTIIIALVLNLNMIVAQDQEEGILGLWLNHEGNSVIEIFEEDNVFRGKVHEILKFPEDKIKEYTKEQQEKGKQQMKGRLVLTDLRFENGTWEEGKILDPKDNTIKASCSITLAKSNKELKLKIKKGFFSTTKTWTKYTNQSSTYVH